MHAATGRPPAFSGSSALHLCRVVRIGGLAGSIGGLLLVATQILEFLAVPYDKGNPAALRSGWYGLAQGMSMLAVVLVALGVVAIYLRQASALGSFGIAMFLVALAGTVMYAGTVWSATFIFPTVVREAPEVSFVATTGAPTGLPATGILLSAAPFILGWLLLAVGTLRARILTRWPALLLFFALPALFLLPPESGTFTEVIGPSLLGVAIAALSWNAARRWTTGEKDDDGRITT